MSNEALSWTDDEVRWTSLSARLGPYVLRINDSSIPGRFVWTASHDDERAVLYGDEVPTVEEAKQACQIWLSDPIHCFVVEEAFEITGRGTAVTFDGCGAGIQMGQRLPALLRRHDDQDLPCEATLEFLLRRDSAPQERATLLWSESRNSKSRPIPRSKCILDRAAQQGLAADNGQLGVPELGSILASGLCAIALTGSAVCCS